MRCSGMPEDSSVLKADVSHDAQLMLETFNVSAKDACFFGSQHWVGINSFADSGSCIADTRP